MAVETERTRPTGKVGIIVIGYNDARHIKNAVLSALHQGPAVAEVVVVDDASTDDTATVLADLARRHPTVRVVRRTVNSGGCGTPRNDGLREATTPYVMFLDSDDELPPGAVDALLAAAVRHDAPVVAGACLRRELPEMRDTPWQHALFRRTAVHDSPAEFPELVRDTLCVNKLYSRAFLSQHDVSFPEGAFRYEDFVFTARMLAASPRIALIPDTVYLWHVRRSAAHPSISLARSGVDNWLSRLQAHRTAVEVFELAGQKQMAHAARVKFLDHDLRMYVHELGTHDSRHHAEWWRLTREHLASFDESDLRAAEAPARWLARVVTGADRPRDLARLIGLGSRPARLLPPYACVNGRPVWASNLPEVVLDSIESEPLSRLPVSIDAEPHIWEWPGALHITVHELYGRLAAADPKTLDIELRRRNDGRLGLTHNNVLKRHQGPDGLTWTAKALLNGLDRLAGQHAHRLDVWDVWARVRCADGSSLYTCVRATGSGLRRTVIPGRRHGVTLVQPYATAGGSLSLRIAAGPGAAAVVVTRRLRRLMRRNAG
ncbi:glycosyltransferase family 2 protein [Streptomyces sp. ISL-96]|uniref:glycosyltransferase family 2 protein n=1 Tax=Streptomyces sp. ISL-96 TaxID=2819191 RepID=UPI001BE5723D|nr:glycosyltransferase family 2 protein [Streptomyces sp. ISL-96]MBT2493961.1 glycosyltransferase family 2 protein [Streptomyces sp. ISL-96]